MGVGNDNSCCSYYADDTGYCADLSATGTIGGNGGTSAGGSTGSGGTTGGPCDPSCYAARGYHCENGQCVLNGNDGPVQVTLDWSQNTPRAREDMDLHVIDPNGCEIYYGHRTCGAGKLDLDQNAACGNTDNAGGYGNDVENVIYDPDGGMPPSGTYQVWAVDWRDNCDSTGANPFAWSVTIRVNGQTSTYHGNIPQGSSVSGGALGSNPTPATGRVHVTDFTY